MKAIKFIGNVDIAFLPPRVQKHVKDTVTSLVEYGVAADPDDILAYAKRSGVRVTITYKHRPDGAIINVDRWNIRGQCALLVEGV